MSNACDEGMALDGRSEREEMVQHSFISEISFEEVKPEQGFRQAQAQQGKTEQTKKPKMEEQTEDQGPEPAIGNPR